MKHKILLFSVIFLIYLTRLTASDGQLSDARLPDGVIARFNPGASVYTVAFSPDGKLLASGGDDNAVILWDVADGSESESFIEHGKSVMSIAFSPDGHLIASASLDGFVRLWPVSSERRRVSLRHNGWVESVAFTSDGKKLASGGGEQAGSVILWDVSQKRDIANFSGHDALVESVAFSSDGLLASASRDGTIKIWDVVNQRVLRTLAGHSSVVHAAVFSPDGKTLASSSRDKTIKFWKISSGENFATFEIQNSLYAYAESIAFSPDGQLLAAACVDYTVRLWNISKRHEVATLTGHHGGVTSVVFSPDGRTLASGSRDRTVLLWNLSHFGVEVPPVPDVPENLDFPEVVAPGNLSITDLPGEPESLKAGGESLLSNQDITPPDIVIRSPIERIVDSLVRQISVEVNVSDDSRIAEVQINGRRASILKDDIFSATVLLNQSKNEIRIAATDAHGNIGTHQFIIEKSYPILQDTTPPEITFRLPTSRIAHLTDAQFTVEGRAIDDGDITEVWVKDREVKVSEAGVFITTIPLDFGENEVRIVATDSSGNMGTDLLTFYREDNEGPEIHINFPRLSAERGFQSQITLYTESTRISGTVIDPSGVAEVTVENIAVEVSGDSFNTTVPLVYGNNTIRVTATDTWENQSFKELTIRRSREIPHPPDPRTGKDYALLFAIDTYDHWPGLRYPRVDAMNVRRDLEDIYGFQVELIHNPTKADILRELHRYAQKEYAPEDQLLIFFAGHGDFDEVSNMGYLVSRDTKKPEDDNVRLTYFSHSYFRDFIDRMSCKHIFLVMDTCYSGTFDEQLAMRGETENVSNSLSRVDIERIMTYTTRWYLTSGANEQVPDDSPFIRALLNALRSKGGRDNVLTLKELLTHFEGLNKPKPCSDEFGRNAPGSDFLFIVK